MDNESPIIFADHDYVGDEVIGTYAPGGNPIVAPAIGMPVDLPLSTANIKQHLGISTFSLLGDEARILLQRETGQIKLTDLKARIWGQSNSQVVDGSLVSMTTLKWDWRIDGNQNINVLSKSVTGNPGGSVSKANVQNRSTVTTPSALSGNGYAYMDSGFHTLNFKFSNFTRTNSQHKARIDIAVFGYANGYLSGDRKVLVPETDINTTGNPYGERTYEFYVNSFWPHVVINFEWWVPTWSGKTEGVGCDITDAKVVRTST